MHAFRVKYFGGDKAFYKKVAKLGVPGALQHLLQSTCGIVDSLMVSWIGHVSSVGTAAQIDMIASTISYGINTGCSMFTSQFFGAKDYAAIKKCFGLDLILLFINALFWMGLCIFCGEALMRFYIRDPFIVENATKYLQIVCYSYVPACLGYGFAYMYRSTHKAHVPFLMSTITMLLNLAFNYVLIFGKFGFPELGLIGAAYGTLIAQCTTLVLYVGYSYYSKAIFIGSFHEMFSFDVKFAKPILKKTYPLIFNELLFSFGNTLFIKAFGSLGKDAMDAYFVGNKISEIFYFIVWGLCDATTIILGTTLGEGNREKALKQGNYFIGIGIVVSVILVSAIGLGAYPLVMIFQLKKASVVQSAVWIVQAFAVKVALRLFNSLVFSSMRAGGESKLLMFLDSGITWAVGIPMAFILVNVVGMTQIALVFLFVQIEALVRVIIGMRLFRQERWANNLVHLVK